MFALLYMLDRLLKLALVAHFFRQSHPGTDFAPSISLIQPVTCGATNLRANLMSRLAQGGNVQHLVICDADDTHSIDVVSAAIDGHPAAQLITVDSPGVATKIVKLNTALPRATGEVLCFIDDDIELQPGTLQRLVPYLTVPGVGCAFGLAYAATWDNLWSGLMSAFVNLHAFATYISAAYCFSPYTITGHLYAIRRADFDAVGGFDDMQGRIDDDQALANRLRDAGLSLCQTPETYRVHNHFTTLTDYANQIRRWFVFPRQFIFPSATPYQRVITSLLSIGMFIPPITLIAAPFFPTLWLALLVMVVFTVAAYELTFIAQPVRPGRWPHIALATVFTPLHILLTVLQPGTVVHWRGQRMRVHKGGRVEVLD